MTSIGDIGELWSRLTNRLVFLEKRYVFRHGGLELHPSELHVLLAVLHEPDANATKLAMRLGITKGAVSQVLKRLEGKRVIVKRSDPTQKNEVTVTFTRLGRAALDDFLARRASVNKRVDAYLASLTDTEAATVRRFLNQIEATLPEDD
ncbi:MAG TPA: MarR family transcriptional regulator [Rhizomicrobium sp.]|nr:MarR family transcriptional regulator [Rhizomicrobium sp.]